LASGAPLIPAIHPLPNTDVSFGGSGASRVDVRVRGHVLDLTMRNADILQIAAIQAVS